MVKKLNIISKARLGSSPYSILVLTSIRVMVSLEAHVFLFVKPGDHVVIRNENPSEKNQRGRDDYWIGQVINCIGGARNPNSWTLFQVADIDNGEIIIINADTVERILKTAEI